MSRDTTSPGPTRFDGPAEPDGLPLYPWNRERFWFERTVEASNLTDPRFDHPLLGFRQDRGGAVLGQSSRCRHPAVARRSCRRGGSGTAGRRSRRDGAGRGPAAAAGLPPRSKWAMSSCAGRCRSRKDEAREIRCTEIGEDGDWELTSRPRLADDPPTLHAVARLATAGEFVPPPLFGPPRSSRGEMDAAALYSLAARLGLDYGGRFRTVRRIEVLGPDGDVRGRDGGGGGATRPLGYRRGPGAVHYSSRAARWRAAGSAGADRRQGRRAFRGLRRGELSAVALRAGARDGTVRARAA